MGICLLSHGFYGDDDLFCFLTHKPKYIYENWNELQARYVVLMNDILS